MTWSSVAQTSSTFSSAPVASATFSSASAFSVTYAGPIGFDGYVDSGYWNIDYVGISVWGSVSPTSTTWSAA